MRAENLTVPSRPLARLVRESAVVGGLAALTALASKLALPLPWTPVPATFQVAAVVFAGAAFGSRRAALAQLVYLACGFAGLPVFASWTAAGPAVLAAPSFGYLLAFPLAAWLAGALRHRWLGGLAALGVIYALGAAWLAGFFALGKAPLDLTELLWVAVVGFLPLDLAKVALAVWSAGPVRARLALPR
ncbi:MAG: biotin transporter BioY [Deltaproteobacteria bacterium]|nr:biotin transporter BioY [Deltaproteobacteria bacterium]